MTVKELIAALNLLAAQGKADEEVDICFWISHEEDYIWTPSTVRWNEAINRVQVF